MDLASSDQVKSGLSLTPAGIIRALSNYGEEAPSGEITEAIFEGFNGTAFVYSISYPSPETGYGISKRVYVQLKRLPFSSNFDFYAEF